MHFDEALRVRFPIVSLEFFIDAFRPPYGPGTAQPLTEMRPGIFFFFYVLLTVHLNIFILVINQLDAQNFILQ